jgi:multidrug efflux pump subunit AcrA (membrane-fusion protein)
MMKSKLSVRCLVTACLFACVGCAHSSQSASPPPKVTVASATERTIYPVVALSGLIAPLQNVAITTSLQEPTDVVYVNEGEKVHLGQILARLDTADLIASASQAAAHLEQTQYQANLSISQGGDQVRSAQAALEQAQSTLKLAQLTLSRDSQLLSQGFIDKQTVDTQQTQVDVDQKAVTAAQAALAQAIENEQANGTQSQGLQKANVDQAAAALQQIQVQITRADIVSPVNGLVVNRNLNPGEYPGTRQIFTLQEIDNVYAELNAFGSQVLGVSPGSSVEMTSPSVPKRTFEGKVIAVLPPTSPQASGFIVKAKVPNQDLVLLPGMTVNANVQTPPQHGISVPVNAFLDDTHQTVITVQDGVAHVADVNEVAEDSKYAIVTGLTNGTQVLANGQAGIVDGEKVAVR